MTRLALRVRKHFENFTLDIDLEAPLEGALGLVGASGSGKSTLLACIAGHLAPDEGRIALGGDVLFDRAARIDVPPARRGVGMVFQEALLFPHMSVRANLLYGVRRRDPALFARVVDTLGVGALLGRRPGALSGGERQRIALGRALLARPRLLLLDEPLASVDVARRDAALELLRHFGRTLELRMVYVSHIGAEITQLTQEVITLADGVRQTAATPSRPRPAPRAAEPTSAIGSRSIDPQPRSPMPAPRRRTVRA